MNTIRLAFLGILMLMTSPSFAWIYLDEVMTRQEQQDTGVQSLNHTQRRHLEEWVNNTFVLKNPPPETPPTPYLTENLNGGQNLRLSDGTLYQISPDDTQKAVSWISSVPVEVSKSEDPDYPVLLTNTFTTVRIKAKEIQNLPPIQQPVQPPPPSSPGPQPFQPQQPQPSPQAPINPNQ